MVNAPERFAIAKWMPALLVGGLVASLAAALLVVLASRAENADRGYREHRSELTVLAGAMPAQAAATARGDAEAFERLAASRATLERVLAEIEKGRSPFAALSSESARRLGGEAGWNVLLDDFAAGARRAPGRGRAQEVRGGVARHPGPRAGRDRQCRVGAGRPVGDARPAALRDRRAAHWRRPRAARGRNEPGRGHPAHHREHRAARAIPRRARGRRQDGRRARHRGRGGNQACRGAGRLRELRAEAAGNPGTGRGARGRAARRRRPRHRRRPALEVARGPVDLGGRAASRARSPRWSRSRSRSCASPARSGPGPPRPACGASRASSPSATAATRTRSCGCSTRCRASPPAT